MLTVPLVFHNISLGSAEQEGGLLMEEHSKQSPALVVLNVCGDRLLREERAKTLHDGGYYTSAARTPEEAIQLATQIHFEIVVVCHSLSTHERRSLREWMEEKAPATTVILLGKPADGIPEQLLSVIRAALADGTSQADLQVN